MRVKSEIDLWVKLLFLLVIALLFACAFYVPAPQVFIYLASALLICGFILWICLGCFYELKEDHILCKMGPFFERIYYDKIKSLRLCRSLLSSMALSVNQIEIRQHGKGYLAGTTLISPVDREQFLKLLKLRCKFIENGVD